MCKLNKVDREVNLVCVCPVLKVYCSGVAVRRGYIEPRTTGAAAAATECGGEVTPTYRSVGDTMLCKQLHAKLHLMLHYVVPQVLGDVC